MDKKTVFVKTDKGVSEVGGQSDLLYGDAKRILHLVDDDSTVADITKRAPPSLRDTLQDTLQELVDGGYIRDEKEPENESSKSALKIAAPAFKMSTPKASAPTPAPPPLPASRKAIGESTTTVQSIPLPAKGSDLDFSFITAAPSEPPVVEKPEADTRPVRSEPPITVKMKQDEAHHDIEPPVKLDPASKKAKLKNYDAAKERAKLEAAARAKTQAESNQVKPPASNNNLPSVADRAREQAEANRAREQAEAARAQEQALANKAREQAEAMTIAKARQEAERLKIEQAAQAEATAKAAKMKAYEAAKEKAKIEVATRARIEAEINQKKEAESVKLKREQEELRARIDAEARIKQEVDAARLKAEREAERLRLELEATRAKAELEHRNRIEAEARARAEAEARYKREAEAERLRLEKERAELEVARIKAESELKLRQEAELRVRAELEARSKADEYANHGERRQSDQRSTDGGRTDKYSQVDSAQKLRDSFVESFGQIKAKQKSGSMDFKLDTFSLIDTGKIAALTVPQEKPATPPGGGSKVKAAIEERARKAAEAQRIKDEQDAALLKFDLDKIEQQSAEEDAIAKNKAAQDAKARIKVEQELYRLKVEQEEQAKAEAAAEAEASKLADQQTKQWEEAQRRAAAQERAAEERLIRQAEIERSNAQKKPSRGPRKPLPIGKFITGLFVLALLAVAGLPYLWPLDEYIAPLEKEISAQIKQTVHLKKINFVLLPAPRLELHTVTVGNKEELKVKDVILNFDFSALFASTRSINKVELQSVSMATTSVDNVLSWLQAAGGIEKYPVAHIELSGVNVQNNDIKLPLLNGKADFDPQGKFTNAKLQSADSKMGIDIHAQDKNIQIELIVHEGNLPILPEIKFNDFSANGIIAKNEIVFSDIFAHVYGGTLTGKANLNWNNGWRLQGQINAKSVELAKLFPNFGVSGELYGDVIISMNGSTLPQLDDTPRLEGTFQVKNGVIGKLDIETTARFGSRPGVAGHTDFSEMIGTLKADTRSQRYSLSSISTNAASGTGQFEVDDKQQLSGKLLVEIQGVNAGKVPLKLSGTTADPMLQQGH